jgi:copper chaperone CopZ
MFRRQFVQLISLAGAGGVAATVVEAARGTMTLTYRVKGFSCITCAVGLDAMLQRHKGVAWSRSSYPDGIVVIKFAPVDVSDNALRAFIAEMGFTVEEVRAT